MEKGEEDKLLRALYPDLDEKDLRQAIENLEAYLRLALRIHEHIKEDPTAHQLLKELLAERKSKGARFAA